MRCGKLFRSGHLGHASDQDLKHLEQLDVKRVFDFRTLADIEADGTDRLPEGASHLRLPMPDPAVHEDLRTIISETPHNELKDLFADGKAAAMMVQAAEGLVRDRREPYRVFLSELCQADLPPALFHCSAGKDRAGWAGTVVLLALGVDEEQVIEQYLLSNRHLDAIRERLVSENQRWGELMLPFLEVRREYIDASFATVQTDWGNFDRYLHEGLGITPEQREQLREWLLE